MSLSAQNRRPIVPYYCDLISDESIFTTNAKINSSVTCFIFYGHSHPLHSYIRSRESGQNIMYANYEKIYRIHKDNCFKYSGAKFEINWNHAYLSLHCVEHPLQLLSASP